MAILVNIVAPYRVPVYEALGESFDVRIFFAGRETNRTTWQDTLAALRHCKAKRSWGFTIARHIKRGTNAFDDRYFHANPGMLWDLVLFRPDAVVVDEMGVRALIGLLYGFLNRKPVWIWWGGTIHTEQKTGRLRKLVRGFVARFAKHWISYGTTSTEYLESIGVKPDRILQIQNCVDETKFLTPVEPAFTGLRKPVLLAVGHLVGLKGVDRLLEAAARVQPAHDFSLVFVGDGPGRQSYVDLAAKLGLRNILFEKPRKPELMPAVYRSADCLIFPTLDDVWGLVVNEALWSGVPVLSSVYAGCTAELVPPCNTFDPLNAASMEEAVAKAATGQVAAPDQSKLKTHRQVADQIVADVRAWIRK